MATAKSIRARKARPAKTARRKPVRPPVRKVPDLHDILDHFHAALALVNVACAAIEALEPGEQLDWEASALRQGVTALTAVYNEFDHADSQLYRAGKTVRS